MKRILVCCDSFKGTFSSFEVNEIISVELNKAGFDCKTLPMADGGEGSLEIISSNLNVKKLEVDTFSADHKGMVANYYSSNGRAFMDTAQASGLTDVNPENRKPLQLSSYGTGLLFKHALEKGIKSFDFFLGGSATVDGGIGLLYGLFGESIPQFNPLLDFEERKALAVAERLKGVEVNIVTDVYNPIVGPQGAATVFGPQKGAMPEDIELLEEAMINWVTLLESVSDLKLKSVPCLGAAGGMALPFVAFANSTIINGYNYFSSLLQYNKAIEECDVLITGEGCIDHQTMMGKGPGNIALEAKRQGKQVVGIGGKVKFEPEVFQKIFATTRNTSDEEVTVQQAKHNLKATMKEVVVYLNQI